MRQFTTCPRSVSSTSMYFRHCGFGHRTANTMTGLPRKPGDGRPRAFNTHFFFCSAALMNFSGVSLNASRQPEQHT